jgi:predicted component of type VI protein secretion system
MRFEVKYPSGVRHEVELQGTLAVLGRDPACDLVLNDVQCSRRHAVVEAGPQGLAIRDAGSANGLFVNGKKIERAALQPGDLVRLGEVVLKVLPEDVPGTVIMAPEEMVELGPPPTGAGPLPGPSVLGTQKTPPTADAPLVSSPPPRPPQPPPPLSAPAPRTSPRSAPAPPLGSAAPAPPRAAPHPVDPRSAPLPRPAPVARPLPSKPRPAPRGGPAPTRPLTVSVLAGLWLFTALLAIAAGLPLAALSLEGTASGLALAGALVLAVLGGLLAFGLWSQRPWARPVQIAVAILGLFLCPFFFASATVLIYMTRSDVSAYFEGPGVSLDAAKAESAGAADGTFVVTIAVTVLFGILFSAAGVWIYFRLMR